MECYVCGAPALADRQVCAECALDYTDLDIAAKRFIAAWFRDPAREVNRAGHGPNAR